MTTKRMFLPLLIISLLANACLFSPIVASEAPKNIKYLLKQQPVDSTDPRYGQKDIQYEKIEEGQNTELLKESIRFIPETLSEDPDPSSEDIITLYGTDKENDVKNFLLLSYMRKHCKTNVDLESANVMGTCHKNLAGDTVCRLISKGIFYDSPICCEGEFSFPSEWLDPSLPRVYIFGKEESKKQQ